MGTYYLMMTFGKFRMMAEKNQKQADTQRAGKQQAKKKKSANKKKK